MSSLSLWTSCSEKIVKRFLAMLALLGTALLGRADVVLVVSEDSDIQQIERAEAVALYMGRRQTYSNGTRARPLDLLTGSPLRERFCRALLGRQEAQVEAWWAQLVFGGRARPLWRVADSDEMIDLLRTLPDSIGYIETDEVPAGLRVVLRVESVE